MINQSKILADSIGDGSSGSVRRRAQDDELRLSRALIEQIPDFLFVKDLQSRFLFANASLAAAYGFDDRDALVGKTDFDLHERSAAEAFYDIEQRVLQHGEAMVDLEESFANSQGVWRWYSTSKLPLRDHDSNIIGMVGIGRDITERKQMERQRQEQGILLEMIAKNEPLTAVLHRLVLFTESQMPGIMASILLYDPATNQLRAGAAPSLPQAYTEAADGFQVGPATGSCGTAVFRRETVVVPDITTDPLWSDYRDIAGRHGLRSCWSTPILAHDGGVLGTFAMYSGAVHSPTPAEFALVEVSSRIAGIAIQRQLSEDRIKFIAHHDALTGLPNRSLLNERLGQTILRASACGGSVAVIFIDLDNFKVINDGLGHKAGDHLLRTIAARMSASVGEHDSIIRLGGDEFVVALFEDPEDPGSSAPRLERLNDAVRQPVEIEGRTVRVTCSMGVAAYPADGRDPETLVANADAAMYSAKDDGRNAIRRYATRMNAERREHLQIQEYMRDAIERGEMSLAYQPQVDLRTGRVFGVEALLRWTHPTIGAVPPSRFVPIAEESGLIVTLGDWVLRTACQQNRAWQDAGGAPISVAVNVSARQFMQRDWASRVQEILEATGMEAGLLDLEVTESMLMDDLPHALGTMVELKLLGVQLSIDDFGTGYSSLSALKSFPVGRLKIDRSFVQDLSSDENDRAIASAVISMGHSLGLRVIAEGVETDEQLDFLRRQGCDEVQGYYFGRPVPAEEVPQLLTPRSEQVRPTLVRCEAPRPEQSAA